MQNQPGNEANATAQPPQTKTLTEEFGDIIQVDEITYLECVIAHKQGVTFRWIWDVDNVSYKIMLQDQHFDQ